ncbi:procathepsin L [Zeugodacus cucurbitae]|uniref:Cathepsin L1 n=1 Tax=Zeugodacus cucurbitae TaxID=28588 RepID=A0A0A1XHX3_ZEUCU|nr:procathepsin L [Zeugodacus cucurbitae]
MRFGSVVWLLPLFFALAAAQIGFQNVFNLPKNVGNTVKETVSGAFKTENYGEFFKTYGKAAWSEAEKKVHEAEYLLSQQLVDLTNAGKKGYTLGMNAFAAVTNAEFLKFFTGNSKSATGESKASADREEAAPPTTKVPDAFDWRTKGGVTPVKFQDECGSCWAFATTGAIEGHVFRSTKKLPNLSEQNLIDCGPLDYGLNGCDGGYQEYAFAFIKDQQKGVQNSASYAYANKQDKCKYNAANKAAEIKGFAVIKPKDEKTMKAVLATWGPLACSVYAPKSLLLYKEGTYADEECNKGEVNHAVLVVGYGSENGKEHWIVKNSWGKEWGEGGYFRLPLGSNYCGIALECSYPIV